MTDRPARLIGRSVDFQTVYDRMIIRYLFLDYVELILLEIVLNDIIDCFSTWASL